MYLDHELLNSTDFYQVSLNVYSLRFALQSGPVAFCRFVFDWLDLLAVSLDEQGEPRCSDFEYSLFMSETFIGLFLLYLKRLTGKSESKYQFLVK